MEAIIVAPAQPQAPQAQNNLKAEKANDEATFGPALSQAISEKNNKPASREEHSARGRDSQGDNTVGKLTDIADETEKTDPTHHLGDDKIDDVADVPYTGETVPHPHTDYSSGPELSPHLFTGKSLDNLAAEYPPAFQSFNAVTFSAAEVNQGKTITSYSQFWKPIDHPVLHEPLTTHHDLLKNGIHDKQQEAGGNFLNATQISAQLIGNDGARGSVRITHTDNSQSFSLDGHNLAAQENLQQRPVSVSNIAGTQQRNDLKSQQPVFNGQKIDLPNTNDTISWSQTRSAAKNTTLLNRDPFLPGQATIQSNVTAEARSLSPEKLLGKIVSITADPQSTGLRSENSSLRQDIVVSNSPHTAATQRVNIESGGHLQLDLGSETSSGNQPNNTAYKNETSGEIHFSQTVNQLVGEKTITSPTDIAKPGTSVFHSPISEDNILHQVLQKFRISQTNLDTKMTLKLHPVELGALKINLQLKDGVVNASILAQSQQVQEILEKNMPRLRELMEQQGLLVENMSVSFDSDVEHKFNLFEDHLSKDQDNLTKKKHRNSNMIFTLEPESEEVESDIITVDSSSVNVKV